jgi:predicted helicase
VFITDSTVDINALSGQTYTIPLKLFQGVQFQTTEDLPINYNFAVTDKLLVGGVSKSVHVTELSVFNYVYAVLHSPTYRERYKLELQKDFPRIPTARNMNLFTALDRYGSALSDLHLLKSTGIWSDKRCIGSIQSQCIDSISWSKNTVWIDKSCNTGFEGVSAEVWKFQVGGYQVCHKWLKDRKGRTLTGDDIAHYHKIIVALSETIRIMHEIDEVIEQHGGWPGAFQTAGNTLSTAVEYKYDERTPKAAEGTLFED